MLASGLAVVAAIFASVSTNVLAPPPVGPVTETRAAASAERRSVVAAASGVVVVDPRTGRQISRLTNVSSDRRPIWSPNGNLVAFGRGYLNNLELWIAKRDGSPLRRITSNDRVDQWPSWAPDSRRLVVERWDNNTGSDPELVVLSARGHQIKRLTHNQRVDHCPAWSPNGRWIAFARDGDIWRVRPDGTGDRRLTSGPSTDTGPIWSPDGKRILFIGGVSTEDEEIFVMQRDGSRRRPLTDNDSREIAAGWSPDGRKIAYIRDGGGRSLWVARADGTRKRKVVAHLGESESASPTWSKSAQRLVYSKARRGSEVPDVELWSVRADGSRERQLTNARLAQFDPDWYASLSECLFAY